MNNKHIHSNPLLKEPMMDYDQKRIKRKLLWVKHLFDTNYQLLFNTLNLFTKLQLSLLIKELQRAEYFLNDEDKSMIELMGLVYVSKN